MKITEEELELLIANLCLDEKPHIEKSEIEFSKRLLKLYWEDEDDE